MNILDLFGLHRVSIHSVSDRGLSVRLSTAPIEKDNIGFSVYIREDILQYSSTGHLAIRLSSTFIEANSAHLLRIITPKGSKVLCIGESYPGKNIFFQ